jgi:ABC-type nitrate/sulfonate/bicarbonate transport system ATPase subunit
LSSPPPALEVRQVSKRFHANGLEVTALEQVSFAIAPQEFVTIVGPSGSGKSTLFNLIVGLLEPDEGEICLEGERCAERIGRVGYMPQRDLLLPWRSVLDNVIVALELRGEPPRLARQQAREMLPLFGLEGFAEAYPAALSGGMRQRAALLRAVLGHRSLLLLDEPFGALDALTRREMQDWLLGLWHRLRQTILFITHDVDEAVYLGDRALVLSTRPGRVVGDFPIPLPRPRRQSMVARPEFGELVARLLTALGVPDEPPE